MSRSHIEKKHFAITPHAPRIGRSDAALVLISTWKAKRPDLQQTAANVAMATWDNASWPAGLISHHVYAGLDGQTVLNYSQWTNEASFDHFLQTGQPDRARKIEAAPAGIEREALGRYRYYRSLAGAEVTQAPGCVVLVTFRVADAHLQTQLVDGIIAAATSQGDTRPGALGSHFHLSVDGRTVVNVAEFTNEQAHESVVRDSLTEQSEVIRLIRSMPGVEPMGFTRFRPMIGAVAT
jgi:heme-degrading monooxygenase HmoA